MTEIKMGTKDTDETGFRVKPTVDAGLQPAAKLSHWSMEAHELTPR